MGKSTISMAIFNSYFDITRGYVTKKPTNGSPKNPQCFALLDSMDGIVSLCLAALAAPRHGWTWGFPGGFPMGSSMGKSLETHWKIMEILMEI